MPFHLRNFTSEINKSGIARPSYFMMMITLPKQLLAEFPGIGRAMQFRVESASLPTRIVHTHEQRYYGPMRRLPYGYTSQDLVFTVIMSEDYREREVFMRWQDLVLGDSRTRKDGAGSAPTAIFDTGYYKDAVMGASVELRAYSTTPGAQGAGTERSFLGEARNIANAVGIDTSDIDHPFGLDIFGIGYEDRYIDSAYSIKLIEPFPINVNEVPLNWSDDGYGRLNIIMQYRYTNETCSYAAFPWENNLGSFGGIVRSGINAFNRFRPAVAILREEGVGGIVDTYGGEIRSVLGV